MPDTPYAEKLEHNLRLYPLFRIAAGVLPWLSIFYLFFIERVSVSDAIVLGAIYYLAVVFFEVPSGYLSDRLGRKPILLLSATFLLTSYITFIFSTGFGLLVVGEILLAGGIAFQSGSDTSLLFDSLKQLGRESEYGDREARAEQYGLYAASLASLAGGFVGMFDLRLSYVLGVFAALGAIYICLGFTEPEPEEQAANQNNFVQQLKACLQYMKRPVLAWIFVFYILAYALQHIPYEFYQPYIKLLEADLSGYLSNNAKAPLISGIVMAISMFGGAVGASISMQVYRALGLTNTLLVGITAIGILIFGMAVFLHPAVLFLIMCRNLPMSLVHAPMMAAIGPRVESAHRATYLSLQSLFGRLFFSGLLYCLAIVSRDRALDWQVLSQILWISTVLALISIVVLAFSARFKGVASVDAERIAKN